jgi:HK97 family phage prohead protease
MYYKTFPFTVEKAEEDSDQNIGRIRGYGSIFGNADSYNEIVSKGAFIKSLNEGKRIKTLWQHDSSMPIGNWADLKEDNIGLIGDAIMPLDIASVKEKYQMAKAGLVDGLSIGYMIRKNGYEMQDNGTTLLKDLDLREISLVTFPANPLALISNVKNFQFSAFTLETELREKGFTKSQALEAVIRAFNGEPLNEKKEDELAIIKSINTLAEAFKRGIKA